MALKLNQWTKSSNANAQCVEVLYDGGTIEVRNSNKPEAGSVFFTEGEWNSFLDGAKKSDTFDLPA